jgi:molybdopterin-guanine dinucleotide biosynthesis protein A
MPRETRENGTMITHTIGTILAGGDSSRMGRSKSLLVVDGASFLDRVHETMASVFTEVIVCGGSEVPLDGVLIADERPGEGPLGGLLSALRIARGRPVFVTTVDMPVVTAAAIRSIVEPETRGNEARVAHVEGEDQPLFAAYGSAVEPIARAAFEEGRRSVRSVLDEIDEVMRINLDSSTLFNVNTEADYDLLIERHGL